MKKNFVNPVAINYRGKVVYFVSQPGSADESDKVFYNVLNAQAVSVDNNENWDGYNELEFPAEVSLAGVNLLRVKKAIVNKGFFQVLTDEQHIYVVRAAATGLYVNRYLLVEVPNPRISGATRMELQPAWETRFKNSGKPDTPANEKDSLAYANQDGEKFIEPIFELPFGYTDDHLDLSHGYFTASFLPTQKSDVLQWQFLIAFPTENALLSYNFERSANGWFAFSPEQLNKEQKFIKPSSSLSFTFDDNPLALAGAPSATLYTKQEPVTSDDSTVLKLQQAYRMMAVVQLSAPDDSNLLASLDMAITKDGTLAIPLLGIDNLPSKIALGRVDHAAYSLELKSGAELNVAGDPLILGDTFTQQVWFYSTAGDGEPKVILGNNDPTLLEKDTPPSVWLTDKFKISLGFGDGTKLLTATTQTNAINANAWNNLIVTFSEGKYSLLVNGAEVKLVGDDFASAIPAQTPLNSIGKSAIGTFSGEINEVKIWSKADPETAKKYIYERIPKDVAKTMEALELYYPLDEGSGIKVDSLAANSSRQGALLGAIWASISSPLKARFGPNTMIDKQGLVFYAGAIVPDLSSSFKQFGAMKLSSRADLLSSADGMIHMYYQGVNDELFAAHYDTSNSRAHYGIPWAATATDSKHNQEGEVVFSSRQTGAIYNHSKIEAKFDPNTHLTELSLNDGQNKPEIWKGLPGHIDYIIDVLSGNSINETSDPRLYTGERKFYDYDGQRNQYFQPIGPEVQKGLLQLASQNLDDFVFNAIDVKIDGQGTTSTVNLEVALTSEVGAPKFQKSFTNVSCELDEFIDTLNGSSTIYDYANPNNTDTEGASLYDIQGETGSILAIVPDSNFSITDFLVSDSDQSSPTNPLCNLAITIKSDETPVSATWDNIPRESALFIKAIKTGETAEQKAVSKQLEFYQNSTSVIIQNGNFNLAASLYAMTAFLVIFKLNATGEISGFNAKLSPVQGVESDSEASNLEAGSLLFGVYANGTHDNGFPALIAATDNGSLLQPGRDGGWLAESPKYNIDIVEKRSGAEIPLNTSVNKPIKIEGSLTMESWVHPQPLTDNISILDPIYSRFINAKFDDAEGGSKYLMGMTYSTACQFNTSSQLGPGRIVVQSSDDIPENNRIFGTETYSLSFYVKANLNTAEDSNGNLFVLKALDQPYPVVALSVDKEGALTVSIIEDSAAIASQQLTHSLQDKTWMQISVIQNGKKIHLYVNGEPDCTVDFPEKPVNFPLKRELLLANNDSPPFEMSLNQVAVWNRSLSDLEVREKSNSVLPIDDEGLILLYRLDASSADDKVVKNEALLTQGKYDTEILGFFGYTFPGVFCSVYAGVKNKVVITQSSLLSVGQWNHVSAMYGNHYGVRLANQAYGDCGNEDNLNFESAMTIESWIKPGQRVPGAGQVVFSKFGQATEQQSYELGLDGRGIPYFKIKVSGQKPFEKGEYPPIKDSDNYFTIVGGSALETNKAYFLAATMNITMVEKEFTVPDKSKEKTENEPEPTKQVTKSVFTVHGQVYVDGMPSGAPYKSSDLFGEVVLNKSTTNVNLGRTKPEASPEEQQYFTGSVSDTRIWNTNLSSELIKEHYEVLDAKIDGEGLISAWYFSTQKSRTAYDTVTENNMLLSNRDLWITFYENSNLQIVINGIEVKVRPLNLDAIGGYGAEQFKFGSMLNDNPTSPAYLNTFLGKLDEVRIWSEYRTLEQIRDNKERFLTGRESQLAGYWRFQEGSGNLVFDNTGLGNDAHFVRFNNSVKYPIWNNSDAPISNEAGIVINALGGKKTAFSKAIKMGPTVIEYADSQLNFKKELFSIYKRCYIYVDTDGVIQRDTNFKIGDLDQVFLGQIQSKPSLIGFIEGAPPLPSENLTMPYYNSATAYLRYNNSSNVALSEADDTTVTFSANNRQGSHLAFGIGAGFALGTDLAVPIVNAKLAKAEFSIGVANTVDWASTETQQTGYTYGISKNSTNKMENAGVWESKGSEWEKRSKERRFIPDNTGYALVESMTADMYALYLASTGAMVGFTVVPNLDIPKDKNIIYFPINPKYIKNGTLDGKVGLQNDPDYPDADVQRGSYFKPIEAYTLKRKIEKKEADLLTFYDQFKAVDKGKSEDDSLTENDTNPIYNFEDGVPRADLVDNYVWTASGGFYSQKESVSSVRQESYSGAYFRKWSLGLKSQGKFLFGFNVMPGFYYDLSLMGGTDWTITVSKNKNVGSKFSLDTNANPDGFLKRHLGESEKGELYTKEDVPGKVNAYRFMSYFLAPDKENFDDFFTDNLNKSIVDHLWLRTSDDPQAAALREAKANPNDSWRILHRVTYVSRIPPKFSPTPLDTDEIKKEKPLNMPVNEIFISLVLERLSDTPAPENSVIGSTVREVINNDLLKIIPWWAEFLKAAQIDNSQEYNTKAEFTADAIKYMLLYFETRDD